MPSYYFLVQIAILGLVQVALFSKERHEVLCILDKDVLKVIWFRYI